MSDQSKERWEVSAHLLNDLCLQHTAREVYEGSRFLFIEVIDPTGDIERFKGEKRRALIEAERYLLEWRLAFLHAVEADEGGA